MSESDEYKEIIKQCIGSVKEVFGEGRFDDVVASIMKMQEKVLASSIQQEGAGMGQIADESGASVAGLLNELREEIKEELRAVKRRILKLERAVYGASATTKPKEE